MGKHSVREYFREAECPSVCEVRELDIAGMCLHMMESGFRMDGEAVLSLGCGDGRIEQELLRYNRPSSITCADFSEWCIDAAMARLPQAEFMILDVNDLPDPDDMPGRFSVIYSVNLVQYLTGEQIAKLNRKLLRCLTDNGRVYHFGIPDARRRVLCRINNAIVMKDAKYLLPSNDFIDSFSFWHKRQTFRSEGFSTYFITPSFRWERFDAILCKK